MNTLIQTIYPVGSIYIGTTSTCPLSALFGTWEKVSEGRVLWGSDETHEAGETIAAGLPNITGSVSHTRGYTDSAASGALSINMGNSGGYSSGSYKTRMNLYLNAASSSSIYGNSTTVQPPAYVVNIWRRTA